MVARPRTRPARDAVLLAARLLRHLHVLLDREPLGREHLISTPDFTPQALGAFAVLVVTNLIVLFGVDINDTKKSAIIALTNAVVVVGFLVHDAWLRHGRAQVQAARELNAGMTATRP